LAWQAGSSSDERPRHPRDALEGRAEAAGETPMNTGNFFSHRGIFFVGRCGWQSSLPTPSSGLRRRFFNLGYWRGDCISGGQHRPNRVKRVGDGL
jgi:hypothetical protein